MFQWSDEHEMIRDAVKRFVDDEIRPHVEELEHGDLPPYDILRKLFATFGMDAMARDRFAKQIAREKAIEAGDDVPAPKESGGGGDSGMSLIPIIELCRVCPGMVTAMGVSHGPHVGRDHVEGHDRPEGAMGARPADDGQGRRLGDHGAGQRIRRLRLDALDRAP